MQAAYIVCALVAFGFVQGDSGTYSYEPLQSTAAVPLMNAKYANGMGVIHSAGEAEPIPSSQPAFVEDVRKDGAGRVVAGWEAEQGQIPFQISLRMINAAGGVNSCGGSVIHNKWVMTAAHCLANRFMFVVRLGAANITRPDVILEASRRFLYPTYSESSSSVQPNDIGLLGLDQELEFTPNIGACRLQNSAERNTDYSGVRLTVSGYGLTDDSWNGGTASEVLRWVHLTGMSNTECRTWFSAALIQDSTICAGYYNDTAQSACQGDSGGPLTIVDEDGEPTMIGVVSFGSSAGCNSPFPSAYIRPGHYHDWYTEVTGINFDWSSEDLKVNFVEAPVDVQAPIIINS